MNWSAIQTTSYQAGFLNGNLDRGLGFCLQVALTSVWGLYAQGYYDGWHRLKKMI